MTLINPMFLLNISLMRMLLWPLCLPTSESSVFCVLYVLLYIDLDMKINIWPVQAKNKTTHVNIFIFATTFNFQASFLLSKFSIF